METINEELLRTGSRSDLTIKCEGRVFKVHKLIVSTRSPVLARASSNGFLESHTNVIEHVQYDADTVERMIEYIYTVNYGLPTAPTIRVPSYVPGGNGATTNDLAIIGVNAKLIIHARLYAIANYYDIAGLRDLAFRRFKQDIQTHNPEGFIYVIREINELVSKDETRLRGIVHDLCFRNIDTFANEGSFMTALASLPGLQDFTVGLLREVAQKMEGQKRGLQRELERKDAEIRQIKEHRDEKATHTQDVLKTLMGVVAPGRIECSKDTGDVMQYHSILILRQTPPVNTTMANVYTQSLLNEVAELWCTGENSDMTIKCEGREFKVHRLLVSAASPILKAVCQNGMRESQTGVVEHKTFDAETVERMLEFIYTRDYEVPWIPTVATGAIRTPELESDADEVLVFGASAWWIAHTTMYAIGDYYQLPTLKARALGRLQTATADTFELRDFAYVVKEAHELIGMHETGFHLMIQDFCLERVAFLTVDKTFMTAIAEVPELQEFAAILLGRVTKELVTRAHESEKATATLANDLEWAKYDLENAKQSLESEQRAHQHAIQRQEDLEYQLNHYQAVIERLMDDVGKLPLRCPNVRCGSTNKAPLKLQRLAHAEFGEGKGFVEIKCGRCRDKMPK
ncbi:hypothetical protein KC340_g17926 [Hortaea werneckii]|nr:hypothetical protein KC342_g16914 [Hortaea werneckii]KAI7101467.1 hypothetical protein KC339_g6707 [Hortaea werneckii]KAI7235913.1 hypothetical protein KC365_g5375 [Hortaea werneckii]KAI7288641.1 hypothetical protein KC340_g17926 [Hortaea werneckii]KAI7372719.1 hypothetical protein KC328_g17061 [Hortaea werneckii]